MDFRIESKGEGLTKDSLFARFGGFRGLVFRWFSKLGSLFAVPDVVRQPFIKWTLKGTRIERTCHFRGA